MMRVVRYGAVGIVSLLLACGGPAMAQGQIIARWVQYAPGTAGIAGPGLWGNAPTSRQNTILVRVVVTDATNCPTASLDHGTSLILTRRFIGDDGTTATSLTHTPGAPGADNARPGMPQYFVQNTISGAFADGMQKATTGWGECEAVVPPGHQLVTVDGVDLKLPVAKPRRILVIGDTGCRADSAAAGDNGGAQACQSPAAFPFSYLSQYEATFNPDVILHLGNWSHRAPARSDSDAAGGDVFDSWNADVFFPARTLLAAAPWIMVRGSDESCGRGARGWYALLDPFPYLYARVVCAPGGTYPAPHDGAAAYTADFEPSYVVPLNGVNFIIHDSSNARETPADLDLAENYDVDLSTMWHSLRMATQAAPAIFVTHRPTFERSHVAATACEAGHGGAGDESASDADQPIFSGNLTLQAVFDGSVGSANTAFGDGVPDDIALFLSGHARRFRYLNVGTGDSVNQQFAPQLILATGGSLATADCSHGSAADIFANDGFGFAVLDAITDSNNNVSGYRAEIYKVSAARAGICSIVFRPRQITCQF
jgi:hypothetical protein